MKFYKQIIFILIIFLKTETLLSQNNLFNVNNIKLIKKDKISNSVLADQAIKKGFRQLITKILLKEDVDKLLDLDFNLIKKLVTYYQISDLLEENTEGEFVNFSVTFDKDKLHDLFFKKGILYSEISDKELYILPISIKNDEISVFNKNFFYTNWNKVFENDLIEFILPIENIEIIQIINKNKDDLIELNISNLFQEYTNKNLALVLIEENKSKNAKVYIKSKIQGKSISKNLDFNKKKLEMNNYNEEIISEIKKELINLVKSVNLIDIRTPSFLNVTLKLNKKSNLVILNSRVKKIDSIENVFVQDFNKDSMNLRIKYLGKLEKIINQLKKENINLQLNNDQWIIKTL
jgi:hypothetical protein